MNLFYKDGFRLLIKRFLNIPCCFSGIRYRGKTRMCRGKVHSPPPFSTGPVEVHLAFLSLGF